MGKWLRVGNGEVKVGKGVRVKCTERGREGLMVGKGGWEGLKGGKRVKGGKGGMG